MSHFLPGGSTRFLSLSPEVSRLVNGAGYKDKEYQKASEEKYMGRVQMFWSHMCDKALAAAVDSAESLSGVKGVGPVAWFALQVPVPTFGLLFNKGISVVTHLEWETRQGNTSVLLLNHTSRVLASGGLQSLNMCYPV